MMLGLRRGNFSSQPEAAEFCCILVKKCHEDQDPQLTAAAVRPTPLSAASERRQLAHG